jgi:phage baseplate assembly protein W
LPVAKKWSDIDLDFSAHPNTGKLSMKTEADAIVRAVRYLLLTNHYERPFHPEFGSNLSNHLFEPMTYATSLRIKDSIVETLENFEPRVSLTNINVSAKEDQNAYHVRLRFFIINEEVERQTEFLLERTR